MVYWPHPSEFSVIAVTRRPKRAALRSRQLSAGPRKPLHLDGRASPIEVAAADPALIVTRGARRMQFPLARLSRILVRGHVTWHGQALALCLVSRVPVVFLDAGAQPLGAALALQAQPGALDELLAEFVDRPHWRERFDNWLRSRRLRILRQWRLQRCAAGAPVDQAEWTEAVRAHVYVSSDAAWGPAAGDCYALALLALARAGARTQYRAFDGGILALGTELARLLQLRVSLHTGTLAQHLHEHGSLQARAFERCAADHEAFLDEMLHRLGRMLNDWIEPWP